MTSPDPRRDNHGNSSNSRDPLPIKQRRGRAALAPIGYPDRSSKPMAMSSEASRIRVAMSIWATSIA